MSEKFAQVYCRTFPHVRFLEFGWGVLSEML